MDLGLDFEIEKLVAREYELNSKLTDAPLIANGGGFVTLIGFSASAISPLTVLSSLKFPLYGFSGGLALGFFALFAAHVESRWDKRAISLVRDDWQEGSVLRQKLEPLEAELQNLEGMSYRDRRRTAARLKAKIAGIERQIEAADEHFIANDRQFAQLVGALGFWAWVRSLFGIGSMVAFVTSLAICLTLITRPTAGLKSATEKVDVSATAPQKPVCPQTKTPGLSTGGSAFQPMS